jgi:hypothetical protein
MTDLLTSNTPVKIPIIWEFTNTHNRTNLGVVLDLQAICGAKRLKLNCQIASINLENNQPILTHYSDGVKVLA